MTNTVDNNVNPEMLVLARESRGMSQAELAKAIGVTQAKISKYENGLLNVSEADLEMIAKALRYTTDLFQQKDKVYGLGSSFLFNRKRKTVPIGLQRRVQAQINILRLQVERLLKGVDLESANSFDTIDIDTCNGDVEKVARLVRANWQLPMGPVSNVTTTVEDAGGIVLKCDFGTPKIDAAHLWVPAMPPMFFLNTDIPGDRQRWTLAHEIGHAVMHRTPFGDVEEEADRFASAFLMPAEEIGPFLNDMTLQKAAILKQRWKVSMSAIVRRSFDLEKIPYWKYRSLNIELGAKGYRKVEPFPVAAEEPELMRGIVEEHMRSLSYNEFDLARLLYSEDPQFFAHGNAPRLFRFGQKQFFRFPSPTAQQRSAQ